MFSKLGFAVFCLFTVFITQPAWAESVYTCPDISKAVKVGGCPSEDVLERMFRSTCGASDTEKENPHAKGICRNYNLFKKAKNTARWESDDGAFAGYLSCDSTEQELKSGKLTRISIGQQRSWDRVICTYEGGAELVLRTRETCSIPEAQVMGRYMGRLCEVGDKDCKAICR